jgi:hypothetical protein
MNQDDQQFDGRNSDEMKRRRREQWASVEPAERDDAILRYHLEELDREIEHETSRQTATRDPEGSDASADDRWTHMCEGCGREALPIDVTRCARCLTGRLARGVTQLAEQLS